LKLNSYSEIIGDDQSGNDIKDPNGISLSTTGQEVFIVEAMLGLARIFHPLLAFHVNRNL